VKRSVLVPILRMTERDIAVLREIARFGAVPPAALAHLFPSRDAAYVRLGILAARGVVARTVSCGQRAYVVTPTGATAAGVRGARAALDPTARTARLAAVAALLAPGGYRPAPPPRPGLPRAVAWFGRGPRVVAVYPSSAVLTNWRARRILGRLRILRHTVQAIVLAGSGGEHARVLHDPRYPPTLITPIPAAATGRALLARLL